MQESDSNSLTFRHVNIFKGLRSIYAVISPKQHIQPPFKILSNQPLAMPHNDTAIQTSALSEAMLLAATGGLLDAFVYLNHGHIFANAMTGNVIFLGIAFLGRDWAEVPAHIVPLVAFFAGVITSKHLRASLR